MQRVLRALRDTPKVLCRSPERYDLPFGQKHIDDQLRAAEMFVALLSDSRSAPERWPTWLWLSLEWLESPGWIEQGCR